MLCRQFCSLYWLQEPAALAAMQAAMKAKPIEEFGPPSAELWSAVLVRCFTCARGGGSEQGKQCLILFLNFVLTQVNWFESLFSFARIFTNKLFLVKFMSIIQSTLNIFICSCADPNHFADPQDVLELSDDQKLALVAARQKLQCTVEDITLQREQVQACQGSKTVCASTHVLAQPRFSPSLLSLGLSGLIMLSTATAAPAQPADSAGRAEGA